MGEGDGAPRPPSPPHGPVSRGEGKSPSPDRQEGPTPGGPAFVSPSETCYNGGAIERMTGIKGQVSTNRAPEWALFLFIILLSMGYRCENYTLVRTYERATDLSDP